jgi:hypothetical protein
VQSPLCSTPSGSFYPVDGTVTHDGVRTVY